jgi:hypothetical protein
MEKMNRMKVLMSQTWTNPKEPVSNKKRRELAKKGRSYYEKKRKKASSGNHLFILTDQV